MTLCRWLAAFSLLLAVCGCSGNASMGSVPSQDPNSASPHSQSGSTSAASSVSGSHSTHPAARIQKVTLIGKPFAGRYPINAVCTTGMVADLAREVGGPHVKVNQLMGAGVDPHLYKASPGDVSALSGADIILYSGLHLEGKMADLFGRMAARKPTYAVTQYLDEEVLLTTDDGIHDPHVWFDASLWRQCINVVRDALAAYDPTHANEYRSRAESYGKKLDDLHAYAKNKLAEVPPDLRVLVTAHDAFRYFGRAYDIEVRGIQGISTESEAGVREINKLVDFIAQRRIKAVFTESSVSERNIQALIEGCRARGHNVITGGELFSDAMGKAGTFEGTYIGMVTHNVDQITAALKGKD